MKKKRKISIFIIGLVIVLTSIGLSYAYWKITLMGDKGNNVTSGCFNIEMINQKDEITLGSTFPITDAEGLKLKPFSFTLKNTCTIFAHYYVNMEMLEGTTLNSKFVAVRVNNEAINTLDTYKVASTTINTSIESRTIAEGYLGADEEVDYTVSFWMDEDATIDDDVMNKVFKSKIVINSEPGKYDPVSAGYDTLHDAILANEYQTTPEIAKERISNKQKVNLNNTAPLIKYIETFKENINNQIIKPTIDSINSISELNNLSSDEQYMYICTTKKFDSESAKYTLSDCSLKDPTTLNYEDSINYYYSDEHMLYDQIKSNIYVERNKEIPKIYKIVFATKKIGAQTTGNITYNANIYNLSSIELNSEATEVLNSDKGLFQNTDDYGITYYYRGNINNNNVFFAGFYWQIIRINGDGTIRLLYNGNEKNAKGVKQSINNKIYQFNNLDDKPAYLGYMYGDSSGDSYETVHDNVNSSLIKMTIDDWYKTNIVENGYSYYISNDAGFCGDRSIYNGDGISTNNSTYFGAYDRYQNNTAQFTCPNVERDLYTTIDSNIGNKALTYPVGLITYDEYMFAGIVSKKINKFSWIYSINHSWTMSPSYFYARGGDGFQWVFTSDGYLRGWWNINLTLNTRPVINLKSDIKITGGIGTANDPFVIDTNN